MSTSRVIRLILAREVSDRLDSRLYLWGNVLVTVAIGLLILIPGLLADDGPDRYELGVVGEVPAEYPDALAVQAAAQGIEITIVEYAAEDEAREAVSAGTVDAALVDDRQLVVDGPPPIALRSVVQATLQQLATAEQLREAGLAGEDLAAAMAPPPPLRVVDAAGQEEEEQFLGYMVAFAATILLFGAVSSNTSSLLSGAVEEKSSRVIEVLLGSVRPWQLLTAKLLAMTALAMAQMALMVSVAVGANVVGGTFDLPPATTATVVVSLVMLLIGFAFFAALFTVAGSLASTTEEAQGSAGPLNIMVMGAYFIVLFVVLPSLTGTLAQILTYLPPTAPFTVPARVALDAISGLEVVIATGVTLLGAAGTVALASRLYSASLLAGGKLSWRQAWRSEPIH